jgi:hypothetical protein
METIECYRHWVEVSGVSFGSGVHGDPRQRTEWCRKKGITKSEKCKCSEILTENVKVEGS